MKKQDLIQKLKKLDGLTADEKATLINLVNTNKKYGLVWEDKPEAVEEQLRQSLPVLEEVKDKAIIAEGKAPNHILIEGDNLHALTALTFTHEGKINVIYIDPPYNTGNKDFKYNDSFVDREDSYRHSKWLSFMHKRLQMAKQLLSDDGVIFISIDDNEQAQLKLLCDDIFGDQNHVATLPVVMNLKGNQDNYGFSDTHEYCLVYTGKFQGKNFGYFKLNEDDIFNDWLEDEYGLYKKADGLRATGVNAPREKRPNLFYPIFINPVTKEFYTTVDDVPKSSDDITLLPINDEGQELSWYWKKSKVNDDNHNLILTRARDGGYSIYKKQRPALGDIPTKKPKSIFYKSEYSTSTSTNELKKMFGSKVFNAPKPVPFIQDLLHISLERNQTVLDFFAGSGTTLHATMRLNAEDNGNRTCILISNSENNICEEITYERNKRAIEGYSDSAGKKIVGLVNNNLRYYRTGFVASTKSEASKRLLTQASTELLQIKENCYHDVTDANGFNPKQCGIFTDNAGRYMVVVYHSRNQFEICEQLVTYIKQLETTYPVKLYAFSPEKETLVEDFAEVADKIDAVPLPQAIYNAYRTTFRTLKLDRKMIDQAEKMEIEVEPELFTTAD